MSSFFWLNNIPWHTFTPLCLWLEVSSPTGHLSWFYLLDLGLKLLWALVLKILLHHYYQSRGNTSQFSVPQPRLLPSVVSAAAGVGAEWHLWWFCFHLPDGAEPVAMSKVLVEEMSIHVLCSFQLGYLPFCYWVVGVIAISLTLNLYHMRFINVFSHVLYCLLSTLYSQAFPLSESWFHSLQLNKIPLCVCSTFFIHSSVAGHQGWLHILVVMNGTAITMIFQSLCGALAWSLLGTYSEVI